MPGYPWPTPFENPNRFRDPEAPSLAQHAMMAVEALCYLVDHDQLAGRDPLAGWLGFAGQLVDMAHLRWGTGTAITAIDLCAAALGRHRSGGAKRSGKEWSLSDLGDSKQTKLFKLTKEGSHWLGAVQADHGYRAIVDVRHRLTHARATRHFKLRVGGPPSRTHVQTPEGEKDTPEILSLCRDVAGRHVAAFIVAAEAGVL